MVVWQALQVIPVCLAKLGTACAGVIPTKALNINTGMAESFEKNDELPLSLEAVDRAPPVGQFGDPDGRLEENCVARGPTRCCDIAARHPLFSLSGFIAYSPSRTLSPACNNVTCRCCPRVTFLVYVFHRRDFDPNQYKLVVYIRVNS